MANWYYYNDKNEKIGTISSTVLKELARQGLVTRETKVENGNGRSALAGSINGLTFPEIKQPETVSPFESNDFGLTSSSFPSSMDGVNFPDLTSVGYTPDDYDPFASTARATPQAHNQPVPAKRFTKPIVFIAIGIGFFFVLPIFIYIIGAFNTEGNGMFQRNRQNSTLFLKEPPSSAENIFDQLEKEIGVAEAIMLPAQNVPRIFEGCLSAAKQVYETGNDFKSEDMLLTKMSQMQKSFVFCMENTEDYLHKSHTFSPLYPKPSSTITFVKYGYLTSGCYWNLDAMMKSIRASVKKLDKNKYIHTIKLCEILSEYEQAVLEPCESNFASSPEFMGEFGFGQFSK